jgi:hypothetical protein
MRRKTQSLRGFKMSKTNCNRLSYAKSKQYPCTMTRGPRSTINRSGKVASMTFGKCLQFPGIWIKRGADLAHCLTGFYHNRTISAVDFRTLQLERDFQPADWEDSLDSVRGHRNLNDLIEVPCSLLPEYTTHFLKTWQYFTAREPLFQNLFHPEAHESRMLQCLSKMGYISIRTDLIANKSAYDVFMPKFRDMSVSLKRYLQVPG